MTPHFSLRFKTPLSLKIGGSKVNFLRFETICLELQVEDQKSKVASQIWDRKSEV